MAKKTYPSLDGFRMLCAFLVIAIHTGVLTSFSETADFFATGVICRIVSLADFDSISNSVAIAVRRIDI